MSDEILNIPKKDSLTDHQNDDIREHFQFETMNDNELFQRGSKSSDQVNSSKPTSGVPPVSSVSRTIPKPASSNVSPSSPPSSLSTSPPPPTPPKNSFSQLTPDSHSKIFSSAQPKKFPISQGEILSSRNVKRNNFIKKFNEYRRHILYLSIFLVILCDLWFVWVKEEKNILAWIHLYYHHPKTVVQAPPSPKTTNFKLLIPTKSKTIDVLKLADPVSLVNLISQQFPSDTIVVLRVKNENGDDVKMSLLNKALAINLPTKVMSVLTNDYNLFVYLPTDNEKMDCQQALITGKECFGPRLGLVFKLKDGQAGLVKDELDRIPMENLIHSLTSIFLFNLDKMATPSETTYRDIKVRYVNLPISTMSLDYAVANDYLIIATSKNSFHKVIDKMIIDK